MYDDLEKNQRALCDVRKGQDKKCVLPENWNTIPNWKKLENIDKLNSSTTETFRNQESRRLSAKKLYKYSFSSRNVNSNRPIIPIRSQRFSSLTISNRHRSISRQRNEPIKPQAVPNNDSSRSKKSTEKGYRNLKYESVMKTTLIKGNILINSSKTSRSNIYSQRIEQSGEQPLRDLTTNRLASVRRSNINTRRQLSEQPIKETRKSFSSTRYKSQRSISSREKITQYSKKLNKESYNKEKDFKRDDIKELNSKDFFRYRTSSREFKTSRDINRCSISGNNIRTGQSGNLLFASGSPITPENQSWMKFPVLWNYEKKTDTSVKIAKTNPSTARSSYTAYSSATESRSFRTHSTRDPGISYSHEYSSRSSSNQCDFSSEKSNKNDTKRQKLRQDYRKTNRSSESSILVDKPKHNQSKSISWPVDIVNIRSESNKKINTNNVMMNLGHQPAFWRGEVLLHRAGAALIKSPGSYEDPGISAIMPLIEKIRSTNLKVSIAFGSQLLCSRTPLEGASLLQPNVKDTPLYSELKSSLRLLLSRKNPDAEALLLNDTNIKQNSILYRHIYQHHDRESLTSDSFPYYPASVDRGLRRHFESLKTESTELKSHEEAPLIVCIHGFMGSMNTYATWATALKSRGFQVLRYDLFGHGKSEGGAVMHKFNLDLCTKQITELFEELGLTGVRRKYLIGFSMGGLVATHLATVMNKVWTKVILLAPAGLIDVNDAPFGYSTLSGPVGSLIMTTVSIAAKKHVLGWALQSFWDEGEPGSDNTQPQQKIRRTVQSYLGSARGLPLYDNQGKDVHAAFARSGPPVLYIWGTRDSVVPWIDAKQHLGELFINRPTDSYIINIPGGDHHVFWEHRISAQILNIIGNWFICEPALTTLLQRRSITRICNQSDPHVNANTLQNAIHNPHEIDDIIKYNSLIESILKKHICRTNSSARA